MTIEQADPAGQLNDAKRIGDRVVVDVEAQSFRIEGLGSVHV